MNTPRKRIALDMDDVMANLSHKFLDHYEKEKGHRITMKYFWDNDIYSTPDGKRLRQCLFEPGFFADLPIMDNCLEVVQWLYKHYEIFIVSAAMEFRNSMPDKRDWMEKHFPFIHWSNIVFCGDKSIIDADYLIDDHVKNLITFKGKGLLFSAAHNTNEKRFTRLNNWLEVKAFFEGELKKDAS